jgi:hypothetical protein
MPRYVILQHELAEGRHWDFLVESGEKLKSWALAAPPAVGEAVDCDTLPDHRPMYLDYEGPISGDRGNVIRWDRGECRVARCDDAQWELALEGAKLRGTAIISRCEETPSRWRFLFLAENAAKQAER